MKVFSHKYIPLVTLICGAVGFALRCLLELFCIDGKGLYMTGHPLYIGLFVLSALLSVWLFLSCKKLSGTPVFPSSLVSLIGIAAAAVGILFTDIFELVESLNSYLNTQDSPSRSTLIFSVVCFVLGVLAAVAMVLGGILQFRGKQVHFLFYSTLTVYLMIHPLSQYRMWSSNPQLLTYCFHLLASICLLLTAYHRTALDGGKQGAKRYTFFSRLALFFCCVSIQGESWLFYLTMAMWCATNLGQLSTQEED